MRHHCGWRIAAQTSAQIAASPRSAAGARHTENILTFVLLYAGPDADSGVFVARDDSAVTSPCGIDDQPLVPAQRFDLLSGRDIPNGDRFVVECGDDPLP